MHFEEDQRDPEQLVRMGGASRARGLDSERA